MLPLYRDPWFTFRFADDRLIGRFCLEGVVAGTPVAVINVDPATGARLGLLAESMTGADGWVDLATPLRVKAGEVFIVEARP